MKKINILNLIFLVSIFYFSREVIAVDNEFFDKQSLYVKSNGNVSDNIVELLGLTGVRLEGSKEVRDDWPEAIIYLKDLSLDTVVSAVKGETNPLVNWLGDPYKERWQRDDKKGKLSSEHFPKIIDICLKKLKQGEETSLSSQSDSPKALLFLGATLSKVRARLSYLNQLYNKENTLSLLPIVILTGKRKLDPETGETIEDLLNPKNGILDFNPNWKDDGKNNNLTDEEEMIKLVFSQSAHEKLSNVSYIYSQKGEGQGEGQRATTQSTVEQWLQDCKPDNGLYIAISNQPYNFYQECVFYKTLLQHDKTDITVKVIGSKQTDEKDLNFAKNLLNNTSRILCELSSIKKISNKMELSN